MAEPVYRTFVGNSSGSSAPMGPKVSPIREKPMISRAIVPTNPALNSGTKSMPKPMMPKVTAISILRRPYFSASGPETRVKIPKNTTPAISIQRKSLRL